MSAVSLSAIEVMHAALTGIARRVRSMGWASTDYVDGGLEAWDRDIEAACAELAVAKIVDRYYDFSEGRFCGCGGDVSSLQVRWTARQDGHLIIRQRDSEDDIYVLVTGVAPQFQVRGWIKGERAKRQEFQRDPGERGLPCWMVPQSALNSIIGLPLAVAA